MRKMMEIGRLVAGCARSALLVLGLAACAVAPSVAQGFLPATAPPYVFADNYGRWGIPIQAQNTYTFSPASACQVTQLNFANRATFYAFSNTVALAPVLIQDVNQANSEVVTPGSYLTPTATTCGANLSPANSHTTATLQSGTGGLQEAINAVGASTSSSYYTIILSPEWYKLINGIAGQNATLAKNVSPASVIANATCSATIQLVDITSDPWTTWSCNPSTSNFVNNTLATQMTVAAGAGAGTGPTIALSAGSTTSSGTVTLTTGTSPTASAAIFTLSLAAPNSGGVSYTPICTVTSIGSPAYTSGTESGTAGSGSTKATAVLTASASALTASQSGYAWKYTCH